MPAKWTKAYEKLNRVKTKKSKVKDTAQYKAFRLAVLERDLHTCVECDTVGGYLEVHHLMPKKEYPDLIYDVDNGVTMCLDCHFDAHPNKPRHRPWPIQNSTGDSKNAGLTLTQIQDLQHEFERAKMWRDGKQGTENYTISIADDAKHKKMIKEWE